MNKKLKELLDKINGLKASVKSLVAAGKLDEAEAKKKEMIAAQREFDLLYDLEDEHKDPPAGVKEVDGGDPDGDEKAPSAKEVGRALVDAIRARLKGNKAPKNAAAILYRDAKLHDQLQENDGAGDSGENTGEDGGLTVPFDMSTRIQELRRATADDLELYVNVENVSTLSGSRVIEVDADATAWPEVDEDGEFQEQATPKLTTIKYKIKKFGGILKVTAELLEDSAENILAYLNKWIAKKSRATRNAKILNALNTAVGETTYKVESFDDLKDIFNVVLDPAIAQVGRVITNQTGYNYLDKMKDKDGKYILQPDPTMPTRKLLFGEYPIVKLSNKVLKNGTTSDGGKNYTTVPVFCGSTEDAVTLFDRNVISLDVSTTAGDLWVKDKTGLKVRDRFDVQVVDAEAVVKGLIKIEVAG